MGIVAMLCPQTGKRAVETMLNSARYNNLNSLYTVKRLSNVVYHYVVFLFWFYFRFRKQQKSTW